MLVIADLAGLPLSADTTTLTLQNGAVNIRSEQPFFGSTIVSEFVARFVVVDGQAVAVLDTATVNGESLDADVVAALEEAITVGFAAELSTRTGYERIESITIANGLMTVSYR